MNLCSEEKRITTVVSSVVVPRNNCCTLYKAPTNARDESSQAHTHTYTYTSIKPTMTTRVRLQRRPRPPDDGDDDVFYEKEKQIIINTFVSFVCVHTKYHGNFVHTGEKHSHTANTNPYTDRHVHVVRKKYAAHRVVFASVLSVFVWRIFMVEIRGIIWEKE